MFLLLSGIFTNNAGFSFKLKIIIVKGHKAVDH